MHAPAPQVEQAVQSIRTLFEELQRLNYPSSFLDAKGIGAHGAAASINGELLVPMVDSHGELQNLQILGPVPDSSGEFERSFFIQDQDTQGLRYVIGDPIEGGPIAVTSRFETAARLHEATGQCCVIGFSPENIPDLLEKLREAHPSSPIVWIDDTATRLSPNVQDRLERLGVFFVMPIPASSEGPEVLYQQAQMWRKVAKALVPHQASVDTDVAVEASAAGRISGLQSEPPNDGSLPLISQQLQELLKEFHRVGNQYFWPGEDKKLAFSDGGATIETTHECADVARGMAKLAKAKGWVSIRLEGTEEFRRRAWLEAEFLNLRTSGYSPDAYDQSELQRRLELNQQDAPPSAAQATDQQADINSPEPPTQPAARPSASQYEEPGLIARLEQALVERGLGEEALEVILRYAASIVAGERAYLGEVIAHGSAPYRNDAVNSESYFITLRHRGIEETVWGVDLARTFMEEGAPNLGDTILLVSQGSTVVKTPHPEFPKEPLSVRRNTWIAKSLDVLYEDAMGPALTGDLQTDLQILDRALDINGVPHDLRQQVHHRAYWMNSSPASPATAPGVSPALA